MQVDYKRDVNHSYLILQGPEEVNTSGYQTRMILCNQLSSLLSCTIQGMDGKNLVYFEITSRQSLVDRYAGKEMKREDIFQIFQGMVRAAQELGSYLLDARNLILAPDFIYLEAGETDIRFCYLPGYEKEVGEQFRQLAEYILPKIDHRDKDAVTLGYGMYRISMEKEFQIDRIKEELYQDYEEKSFEEETCAEKEDFLWEELPFSQEVEGFEREGEESVFLREKSSRVDRSLPWQAAFLIPGLLLSVAVIWKVCGGNIELVWILGGGIVMMGSLSMGVWLYSRKKTKRAENMLQKEQGKTRYCDKKAVRKILSVEQEETKGWYRQEEGKEDIYFDKADGEDGRGRHTETEDGAELTMVLSEAPKTAGSSLVSKEEGKFPPILLDQELLIVGKLKTAVDVVLPYPTVSRVHAKIRKIQGKFYLMDLNSRNGTFVNGRVLESGEEYELRDQDEVQFADISYIFLK